MSPKHSRHYSYSGQSRKFNNSRPRPNKSRQPKKAYIHPSRFVQSAKPRSDEVYQPVHNFSDFALDSLLNKNLTSMGLRTPSPIQDEAIPHGLAGKDVVGIANTGTGKTAAFAIPVLNKLINNPKSRAIILAPTRELAEQIERHFRRLGQGSGLFGALLIGGTAMGPQLGDLRRNPSIIIGTPGRIKDHLGRGSLNISDCDVVVLDEVDRMLDMGFINDIKSILSQASASRQSFYFSATLDSKVKGIIEDFSKDPVYISVKEGETSSNVDQNVITYNTGENKVDKLHNILISNPAMKTIIFDDTHRSVEKLSKELLSRGFLAGSIHGGKTQSQRQRALQKFKTNEITVLVATDVAARGLDVRDITHVINFSVPGSYDDYVHRIGRTGRAGRVGHALTFVEK